MNFQPKQFGIVLKDARMNQKLTQAELAEILDISLPYLKDLERFRNNPSYEVFEKDFACGLCAVCNGVRRGRNGRFV